MARMEAENVITPNQCRYREESDEDSGYDDSVWISPGQQDFI